MKGWYFKMENNNNSISMKRFTANQNLAEINVHKYFDMYIEENPNDLDDVKQIALISLWNSSKNYDDSVEESFDKYATKNIWYDVMDYIYDKREKEEKQNNAEMRRIMKLIHDNSVYGMFGKYEPSKPNRGEYYREYVRRLMEDM